MKIYSSSSINMDQAVALLNAPVLTSFGLFSFKPISMAEARTQMDNGFTSYIGHESTCDILTQLLGVSIPLNRGQYLQQPGRKAIVFKLLRRTPEGIVLQSIREIEEYGYEFGILERIN